MRFLTLNANVHVYARYCWQRDLQMYNHIRVHTVMANPTKCEALLCRHLHLNGTSQTDLLSRTKRSRRQEAVVIILFDVTCQFKYISHIRNPDFKSYRLEHK